MLVRVVHEGGVESLEVEVHVEAADALEVVVTEAVEV